MKNIAIYTSIVGKYDKLYEPDEVIDNYDYICFSNDISSPKNSVWKIRPIPFDNSDKTRQARFIKTNPHEVLKDYQYSLWIDGNVVIKDNYVYIRVQELIKEGVLISIPKHPLRDCAYDEAKIVIKIGKGKKSVIIRQMEKLQKEGFPENFGLFESNIVFRKHMDKDIIELDNDWWKEIQNYSRRDQLSLGYVLWKKQITCVPFFEEGYNVRNHPGFSYPAHKRTIAHKINKRIRIIGNKF
ncbi:MAG: DUF616 domain-containing protein [Bacteroidales bacterium]|nr:DUF616 domain-containing protein [Bacteroidales bacterium]